MNEFKIILNKLKEIIKQQAQTDKKVLDKEVANTLGIKPAILASYKSKNKTPYKAILTYSHNNRLDVRKILFDVYEPMIDYPTQVPVGGDKVTVKYFKTLESYALYLGKLKP